MEKLKELTTIRTGYPFRGRIDRAPQGVCRLVQMGDVEAPGPVRAGSLPWVRRAPHWERHILVPGDVLLISRGSRNDASVFEGCDDGVIAAPHLFVIRIRREKFLPGYLVWFLNLPETQERIRAMRAGSAVRFVPLEALGQLEVPVPVMAVQERVVEIGRLTRRERQVLQEILDLRRFLVDGITRKAVRNRGTEGF